VVVGHLGNTHSEVDQTLKSIADNNWSQSFTEESLFLAPISITIIIIQLVLSTDVRLPQVFLLPRNSTQFSQ